MCPGWVDSELMLIGAGSGHMGFIYSSLFLCLQNST